MRVVDISRLLLEIRDQSNARSSRLLETKVLVAG
jgi:hypothetical protein